MLDKSRFALQHVVRQGYVCVTVETRVVVLPGPVMQKEGVVVLDKAMLALQLKWSVGARPKRTLGIS